ncbi:hypothetical protein DV737_g3840, partial [Chaetothyriales sp. CBS 132003]
MGMASLFSNNTQVLIPLDIANAIGENGINELKSRFSGFFGGASTTARKDLNSKVVRICLLSDSPASSTLELDFASPPDSTPSPHFSTSAEVVSAIGSLRSPGKKAKVPRPPNSFILYRQEYHPKLKAQNPGLHNNDISVILGKQWAYEPESVKEKYKARANAIKKQHAVENPGYQYAPRRPYEKKRRMTARKLAQLESAVNDQTQGSADSIIDLTDSEQTQESNDDLAKDVDQQGMMTTQPFSMSAIEELVIQRPAMNGTLSGPNHVAEMSVLMPMSHLNFSNFEQQFADHLTPSQSHDNLPFDTVNRESMTATTGQHVIDDQDFMNSLIDWEGIKNDADMIQEIIQEEQDNLIAEFGGPDLLYVEDASAKFHAELERLSKLI